MTHRESQRWHLCILPHPRWSYISDAEISHHYLLWYPMLNFMNPLYLHALIGGILIGIAALVMSGWLWRVMGISGIIKWVLPGGERGIWRYTFLLGIPVGVWLYTLNHSGYTPSNMETSSTIAIISGILVGIGTTLANGCTSGHAVCGIGRLSQRSIIATLLFVSSGIATVTLHNFL